MNKGNHPVIMDGYMRFGTISAAARWIREKHGLDVQLGGITASIGTVLKRGYGRVYGHTFSDGDWPRSPAEYERQLVACRKAIITMWRAMDISCLRGIPMTREQVDGLAERLRGNGIEVN